MAVVDCDTGRTYSCTKAAVKSYICYDDATAEMQKENEQVIYLLYITERFIFSYTLTMFSIRHRLWVVGKQNICADKNLTRILSQYAIVRKSPRKIYPFHAFFMLKNENVLLYKYHRVTLLANFMAEEIVIKMSLNSRLFAIFWIAACCILLHPRFI